MTCEAVTDSNPVIVRYWSSLADKISESRASVKSPLWYLGIYAGVSDSYRLLLSELNSSLFSLLTLVGRSECSDRAGVLTDVICVGLVVETLTWYLLYRGSIRASTVLYKRLLKAVLFTHIRFHDTTNRGRLLNRFGKDFESTSKHFLFPEYS